MNPDPLQLPETAGEVPVSRWRRVLAALRRLVAWRVLDLFAGLRALLARVWR